MKHLTKKRNKKSQKSIFMLIKGNYVVFCYYQISKINPKSEIHHAHFGTNKHPSHDYKESNKVA
ncbi:hypothetical protein HanPSC8_Chr15g0681061 [Helianthus annuus]|nr:hypothetical protein HanPSC8_Chr15g0681061 [Helianthus annuus]